jgi:Flp pilus assembly protein TadG
MKIGRGKKRARAGAAAVEAAIILPLMISLIVFPTIEMSQFGMLSQQMNAAAREGCRTAVMEGNSEADVEARVMAIMDKTTLDSITISPDHWSTAPAGTAIRVDLSLSYDEVAWLGTPMLLRGVILKASSTMSSERQ